LIIQVKLADFRIWEILTMRKRTPLFYMHSHILVQKLTTDVPTSGIGRWWKIPLKIVRLQNFRPSPLFKFNCRTARQMWCAINANAILSTLRL